MTARRIALFGSAAAVLLAGYLAFSVPAVALAPADHSVPMTVALTDGATMTVPTVSGGEIAFDLTVPSLRDASFVTPLAWDVNGTRWEVVVDTSSIYVQWSRGSDHGLKASSRAVDNGQTVHVRVDTKHSTLVANGETVTFTGPASGPVVSLTLNPVSH